MGGFLNIEIYQKLESNNQFIASLKELLKNNVYQNDNKEFINSIKLNKEENSFWYEYKKIKFKHQQNKYENIEWDIFVYFNIHDYNYVLELSVLENEIQIYNNEWPYFDTSKIEQILSLMKQISLSCKQAIVIFTDEASQGKFVENLRESKNNINYLFELAILPTNLKWKYSTEKYEKLESASESEIWKSKSRYMRKYKFRS